MAKKPRVLTKCGANHHASDDERIVEFSFPSIVGTGSSSGCRYEHAGGLISFRRSSVDGTPIVNVYRLDPQVRVYVSNAPEQTIAPPAPRRITVYLLSTYYKGTSTISAHTSRTARLVALLAWATELGMVDPTGEGEWSDDDTEELIDEYVNRITDGSYTLDEDTIEVQP